MKSLKSCDTDSSEPLSLQQWDTSRWWSIYAPPVRRGCLSPHLSQTQWEEFQRICQHLEVSFEAWCTRWRCDLKPEMMQWCNGNISDPKHGRKTHRLLPFAFPPILWTPAFFLVKVYSKPKCITRPVQRPKGPKKHPQWQSAFEVSWHHESAGRGTTSADPSVNVHTVDVRKFHLKIVNGTWTGGQRMAGQDEYTRRLI